MGVAREKGYDKESPATKWLYITIISWILAALFFMSGNFGLAMVAVLLIVPALIGPMFWLQKRNEYNEGRKKYLRAMQMTGAVQAPPFQPQPLMTSAPPPAAPQPSLAMRAGPPNASPSSLTVAAGPPASYQAPPMAAPVAAPPAAAPPGPPTAERQVNFCSACGTRLSPEAVFCPTCGNRVQ